jgi:hypothetical protein
MQAAVREPPVDAPRIDAGGQNLNPRYPAVLPAGFPCDRGE